MPSISLQRYDMHGPYLSPLGSLCSLAEGHRTAPGHAQTYHVAVRKVSAMAIDRLQVDPVPLAVYHTPYGLDKTLHESVSTAISNGLLWGPADTGHTFTTTLCHGTD